MRARPARPTPVHAAAAGAAVLLAGAAGCGASHYATAPVTAPRNRVAATPSLYFAPADLTIAVGDSVTWAFAGVTHTVIFQRGTTTGPAGTPVAASPGAPADVGPTADASVTRVFPTRGTFGYGCRLHPGMGGVIRVR